MTVAFFIGSFSHPSNRILVWIGVLLAATAVHLFLVFHSIDQWTWTSLIAGVIVLLFTFILGKKSFARST